MFLVQRQTRKSQNQLAEDFGHFPPSPLVVTDLIDQEFDVVQTSRLSSFFYFFKQLYSLYKSRNEHASEFGYELQTIFEEIKSHLEEIREQQKSLRDSIVALSPLNKIMFFGTLILFSPIVMIIALILATFILLKTSKQALRSRLARSLGYFLPHKSNGRAEVVINAYKIKGPSRKNEVAGILSHEHLHLLQFTTFRKDHDIARTNAAFEGPRDDKISGIFKTHLNKNVLGYLKYLALLNEMEARLHEIVLSYYRQFKSLPINYGQFIDLLTKAKPIQNEVKLYRALIEGKEPLLVDDSFNVRYSPMAEDISLILNSLVDDNMSYRYITEVLPVMYANLLSLYGSNIDSNLFLSSIPKTDLFKQMYGSL